MATKLNLSFSSLLSSDIIQMFTKKITQRRSCSSQTLAKKNVQKAALSSEIRRSRNKPRISKNSTTCQIQICDLTNLSLMTSHSATKNSNGPKLATNNAATYANKLPIRCSRSSSKYKKTQFCI